MKAITIRRNTNEINDLNQGGEKTPHGKTHPGACRHGGFVLVNIDPGVALPGQAGRHAGG